MALGPLKEDAENGNETGHVGRRKTSPLVTWIAIGLGVSMVIIGILMTLWGLSWQANLEETDPLDEDNTFGSPLLIPVGLLFVGFGVMWIWMGYHGFPRREDYNKKRCPHCGKELDPDLDFCPWCTTRLADGTRRTE